MSLEVFDGQLYAGTQNYNSGLGSSLGAQVWRSPDGTTWEKVVDAGFSDVDNWGVGGLVTYRGQIYAITNQYHYADSAETRGMEVWRSSTGNLNSWERVGWHAFGASSPRCPIYWAGKPRCPMICCISARTTTGSAAGGSGNSCPNSIYLPVIRH